MSRFVLDVLVRRLEGGRVLAGGAPGRFVRLTPAGAAVLDRALAGDVPQDGAAAALVRRLRDHGLIHPVGGRSTASVAAVVPVRNGAPWIAAGVAALRDGCAEVIVVDDGSVDGSAELAAAAGARVIRNDRGSGPSGARNSGLAAASTELVALVDADCRVEPGWLDPLVAVLEDDPRLAVAAPRVLSAPGASRLAAYERACSPLDLGPKPGLAGRGRRIGYLPSAALLVRREAVLAAGGFTEELEVGEDVDLVWRLVAAGWRVRYAPESRVGHLPRASVLGLAAQRVRYGASAVALEQRHPGALALRLPSSARHLARFAVREWLPLTALACGSRPGRRLAIAAFAVDAVASYDPDRSPGLAAHAALRLVANASYSLGLWRAALKTRAGGALAVRRWRTT